MLRLHLVVAARVEHKAVIGFLALDGGNSRQPRLCFRRVAVHESYMSRIQLQMSEEVARPNKGIIFNDSFPFKLRKSRKRRRRSFAQIGKYQAQVFLRRVTPNADFGGEARILGRLLHTLSRAIVFPAVIKTADAVAFHPTHRELCSTMRAPLG